jgi:hypothetical protein
MLKPSPPPFRPHRGRLLSAGPSAGPPPPPPPPIEVVSVDWNGTNVLVWHFSADVTLSGGNVPELENDLDGTGAWQSPASCSQGSPTSIAATYPDVPGEATPWRIAAEPSNLEQADRITVPEGGNVV